MKKYMIIFDLDGTILPTVRDLSERTISAVRAAREAGHIVVASSARPFMMFRWVYDALGLDTAVSTLNGAYVFHPTRGDFPVFEREIDRETVGELLKVAAEDGCEPFYLEKRDEFWYTEAEHNDYYTEHIRLCEPTHVMDRSSLPDTAASRVVLTPPSREVAEKIEKLVDSKNGTLSVSWDFVPSASGGSNGVRMSIGPASADKWRALKIIADYYNIPTEDVYAFGDMKNDFCMLENAGHGFALKDSDAERESRAKNVTRLNCAESGVAEVIEREILGIVK